MLCCAVPYRLQIADTVVVPSEAGKAPEVATSASPKDWDNVSYRLDEGEEEEGDEEDDEVQELGVRAAAVSGASVHMASDGPCLCQLNEALFAC